MGFVDSQFGTTVHSCKEKGSVSLSFLPLPCVEERRKCLSSSVATKAIAAAALLCLLLADRGRGAGSSAASFVAREESLGSPEKLRGLD